MNHPSSLKGGPPAGLGLDLLHGRSVQGVAVEELVLRVAIKRLFLRPYGLPFNRSMVACMVTATVTVAVGAFGFKWSAVAVIAVPLLPRKLSSSPL